MAFFILARFVLAKYSRVFVAGTSSLASQLTTVSLDIYIYMLYTVKMDLLK